MNEPPYERMHARPVGRFSTSLASAAKGLTPESVKNLMRRSKALAAGVAAYAGYEMGHELAPLWHVVVTIGPLCLYVLVQGLVDVMRARARVG